MELYTSPPKTGLEPTGRATTGGSKWKGG